LSELLLLAATGLAREVLLTVRASGQYDVLGILDDDPQLLDVLVDGAPVLGTLEDAAMFPKALFAVCLPAGRDREAVVERLTQSGVQGNRYGTVLDPDIRLPDDCRIGPGSILLRHATVGPQVTLGNHTVVMPSVTLACGLQSGDFATFSAGSSLGEDVRVGRGAHIGMNAGVADGLSVGDYSSVGMGAAVLQDVPEYETWVGVPARSFLPGGGLDF
jgi:sugar O-acyltransferase (sialic acid O-acetyltransferase NeuD family)